MRVSIGGRPRTKVYMNFGQLFKFHEEIMLNIPLLRQGQPLRPKLAGVSSTFGEIETSLGAASRNIILYGTKYTNREDSYSVPL